MSSSLSRERTSSDQQLLLPLNESSEVQLLDPTTTISSPLDSTTIRIGLNRLESGISLEQDDYHGGYYRTDYQYEEDKKCSFLGLSIHYSGSKNRFGFLICSLITSIIALFILILTVARFPRPPFENDGAPVRNVIFMISDGFGPASQTMARNYNQAVGNLPISTMLPLDTILVGSSRTRSSSSLVTDSAAGATAFACNVKSYNGAIGVDSNHKPCGTVLEAASLKGMLTGLVATSRITHATPASFASHVIGREDEAAIALQEIGNYTLGRRVDLMFGGGKCFFLPRNTTGSCRVDDLDVFDMAHRQHGWTIGSGLSDLQKMDSLPLVNLFAFDHMSYEIDRNPEVEPSLSFMAQKAIALLDKESRKKGTGFFLMIEGSRIDMAGHSNDPATHVHEILAYNEAIDHVKKYIETHPDTVLVSTSDHETGGLADAKQVNPDMYPEYNWYPLALKNIKHSGEYIARQIITQKALDRKTFVTDIVLKKWLDVLNPLPEDVDFLSNTNKTFTELDYKIGAITSTTAQLGWSTHGHSAVDVNLYAYGAQSHQLAGNHENTEVGEFITRVLDLNLPKVTEKLAQVWSHQAKAFKNQV